MNLTDRLLVKFAQPVPLRTWIVRKLVRSFPIGSYEARLRAGAVDRPWYAWCMYYAAIEAKTIGYKAITAIEFGVASGSGLVCLCRHREEIEKLKHNGIIGSHGRDLLPRPLVIVLALPLGDARFNYLAARSRAKPISY